MNYEYVKSTGFMIGEMVFNDKWKIKIFKIGMYSFILYLGT